MIDTVKNIAIKFYGKPEKADNGFLFAPIVFAEKKVMPYEVEGGKTQLELMDLDDSNTDMLRQIEGLPFVLEHPDELLNPDNYSELVKGVVVDPRYIVQDNTLFILARLKIWDPIVIDVIESGELAELSQGYICQIIREPGQYNGARYDARQTNFKFDHLALVDDGRNGENVRVIYNKYRENRSIMKRKNGEGITDPQKKEEMNQDGEGEPPVEMSVEERLTSLEEKISALTEILKKLMEGKMEPEVPEPGNGGGGASPEDSGGMEPTFNARVFNRSMQEYQATYNQGRAILGEDVDREMSRHDTLDSFRRHCLRVNKSLSPERIARMNAIEVKAYLEAEVNHLLSSINAPHRRDNGGGNSASNGDTPATIQHLRHKGVN